MITLAKLRSKLPLIIMLAIGFLSTISMTIVLPVLPFIVQNHVHDAKNVALWVGVLETVFSACALFSGPVLGALSDRIGRRPVLLAFGVMGTLGTVPLLTALSHAKGPWEAFALVSLGWVMTAPYTSINAVVKAELFPAALRATGVGLPW